VDTAVLCSVQCSAVQSYAVYSAVQCSAVQCKSSKLLGIKYDILSHKMLQAHNLNKQMITSPRLRIHTGLETNFLYANSSMYHFCVSHQPVCSAVQCSVQCSTVQCSAVQCAVCSVQCSAVQCAVCSAVQCSVVQCTGPQGIPWH
jgi:hypothetical protein